MSRTPCGSKKTFIVLLIQQRETYFKKGILGKNNNAKKTMKKEKATKILLAIIGK